MNLRLRSFVIIGVAVSLVLVFVAAPHASSSPDGLEKVAADTGIDLQVTDHAMADSPLADYGVQGIDSPGLGTGVSGALGVVATFVLGAGLVGLLRVTRRRAPTGAAT
jgi:cobalt/nickel transport system permease protein